MASIPSVEGFERPPLQSSEEVVRPDRLSFERLFELNRAIHSRSAEIISRAATVHHPDPDSNGSIILAEPRLPNDDRYTIGCVKRFTNDDSDVIKWQQYRYATYQAQRGKDGTWHAIDGTRTPGEYTSVMYTNPETNMTWSELEDKARDLALPKGAGRLAVFWGGIQLARAEKDHTAKLRLLSETVQLFYNRAEPSTHRHHM